MPPTIMFGNPGQQTDAISISCRFIATDQWLRAHVDPSWTIFELKRHLLARCVGGVLLAPVVSVPSGPRLLVPSPAGLTTLAGLVKPSHASAIKTGGRPSTAPHPTGDDSSRRKPRLSLKVVPGLTKPPPRTVTIHPPTPGIFGLPTVGATGPPPPPPNYFAPRNPELSPPHFAPISTLEDESSPSSPNTHLETISISSRSTVALGFSQPQSHATSPTLSSRASPPSRPFSPTALPRPAESQPLFSPDHPILFTDFATTTPSLRAQSTPPVVRAMSTPPSPYSPKVSTPLTSRPLPPPQLPPSSPPTTAARSPPLPSSLVSHYESSRFDASSQLSRSETHVDSVRESVESDANHSPLLSAVEFLELESEPDVDGSYDLAMRSPSPSGPTIVSASSGSTVFANKSVSGAYYDNETRDTGRPENRDRRNWEDEFRLVSFAQGCILDEHSTVADLRIRPGELLEIQRTNAVVHLARPTYTQPYFEAPVYVLKRTQSTAYQSRPSTAHQHHGHIQPRPHQHHIQPTRDYGTHYPLPRPLIPMTYHDPHYPDSNPPMSPVDVTPNAATRVRSRTVTARDVQDGLADQWDDTDGDQEYAELELSGLEGIGDGPVGGNMNGSRAPAWNDSPASTRPPEGSIGEKVEWKLRWLTMREGRLSLSRYRGGQPQFSRALASVLSAQQLPAVPQLGALPHHYISIHFTGASRREREREREGEIGIRMMDGATHAHLFRVLLRIINTPGPHAFLSTDTPYSTSPPLASQYPEWRQYVVQRAWLAGRGASVMHGALVAGPWMRAPWTAWTDKEAEVFTEDDISEFGDDYEDDGDELYEHEIGAMEGYDQGLRDSDSEIEWDVEGWRAWESENAFGAYANMWLKSRVENIGAGRPRSRSLAAPSSRSSSIQQLQSSPQQTPHPHQPMYPYPSQQPYPHHDAMLSPSSTSSDISSTSPNTRRARSSTIAVPSQPESPGSSSPTAWSPTLGPGARRPLTAGTAGIETILRTSTSNADTSGTVGSRRPSTQSRSTAQRSEPDRRGSAHSLEMQRAMPPNRDRRAVTSPAQGSKIP